MESCVEKSILCIQFEEFECKKKIQGFYIYSYYVGKAFYIGGLIYERKLIGSVTHCSEFKMLMKSTLCTCV